MTPNDIIDNQIHPQFVGIHALNSTIIHDSASRGAMYGGHFSQRIIFTEMEEKTLQSGQEYDFAKYTFAVRMPANGRILNIIERFPPGVDIDSLRFSPEIFVVYEREEAPDSLERERDGEIDCFTIPYHLCLHQFFGFQYVRNLDMLRVGAYIAKGTVFAESPGVSPTGSYMYGRHINIAFMSVPGVSEDGIVFRRKALDKFKFKIYETRIVEFGSSNYPLNLYGSRTRYQPFPEIGDYIRPDGILMMMRNYDTELAAVKMSVDDLREPDFVFDNAIYVRGGTGRVVDIEIIRNNNTSRMLPETMCEQIFKYEKACQSFYRNILKAEERIRIARKKKYGDEKLNISRPFHNKLVSCLAMTNYNEEKLKHVLGLHYRRTPIDEFRIRFVIEYDVTPDLGFKFTDCHGGKGVVCKIEEKDENMPLDEAGNMCDAIFGDVSTIDRSNIGRLYDHYYNAAMRDVRKQVLAKIGVPNDKSVHRSFHDWGQIEAGYTHLLNFYSAISPIQFKFYRDLPLEEKLQHMETVVNKGVSVFYPVNNPINPVVAVQKLEELVHPTYGPVTYVGESGIRCTTVNKVRIAELYIMQLDKTPDEWSSVAIGKMNALSVLSPTTKSEKFSDPFRNNPTKTIGRTEARLFLSYCGKEMIAELMDRSNNTMTQRNMVWNILNAPQAGNIEHVVDRSQIGYNSTRPLQQMNHMMFCNGFLPVYEPEEPRQ